MKGLPALLIALALPAVWAQQFGYPTVYPAARMGGQYMHNYYIPPAPGSTPWAPAWSPDARWIVYTADRNAQSIGLEILNTASGESSELTSGDQVYLDPVFSPDGSRLAYVSTAPNGNFNIFVRPIRDGRWEGPAVQLTPDHEYPRERDYTGKWDGHVQPAWTPDGREIVFLCNRDVSFGSGDLWRMPAEANAFVARCRSV